ncbi:hypothetical protein RCL1_004639 [Eukaryota sp. TZLM3-RCL]
MPLCFVGLTIHQRADSQLLVDADQSVITSTDNKICVTFDLVLPAQAIASSYLYDTLFKTKLLPNFIHSQANTLLHFQGSSESLAQIFQPVRASSSLFFSIISFLFSLRQSHSDQINFYLRSLAFHGSSVVDLLSNNQKSLKISTDSNGNIGVPDATSILLSSHQVAFDFLSQAYANAENYKKTIASSQLNSSKFLSYSSSNSFESILSSTEINLVFVIDAYILGSITPISLVVSNISGKNFNRSFSRLLSQLQSRHRVAPCWRESSYNHLSKMILSHQNSQLVHVTCIDGRFNHYKSDCGLLRTTLDGQSPDLVCCSKFSSSMCNTNIVTPRPLSNSSIQSSSLDQQPSNVSSSLLKSPYVSKPVNKSRQRDVEAEVEELHKALSEEVAKNFALHEELERIRKENERLRIENQRLSGCC